jgi:outer membrane biosynthesis protein TonB
MKTLQRILGLAVFGVLLNGTGLEAQEQPAPAAPEPDAAVQPDPLPEQPRVPPAEEPPPPRPDEPNLFDQPPARPPAQQPDTPLPDAVPDPVPEPLVEPLVPSQAPPPYSPLPATRSATVLTPPADPFLPPDGMVTAPECLIELLGFFGHHPFVYSDSNCFDLASAAYRYGFYEDAIALLSHAIAQYPQAHYYYLRGMAQMQAGLGHDAIASADGVLDAEAVGDFGGLDRVRERFNGPLGVQFRQLLQLRQAAR